MEQPPSNSVEIADTPTPNTGSQGSKKREILKKRVLLITHLVNIGGDEPLNEVSDGQLLGQTSDSNTEQPLHRKTKPRPVDEGLLPPIIFSTNSNFPLIIEVPNNLKDPGDVSFLPATSDRTTRSPEWAGDEVISALFSDFPKMKICANKKIWQTEKEPSSSKGNASKALPTNSGQRRNHIRPRGYPYYRQPVQRFRPPTVVNNQVPKPNINDIEPWVRKPWEDQNFSMDIISTTVFSNTTVQNSIPVPFFIPTSAQAVHRLPESALTNNLPNPQHFPENARPPEGCRRVLLPNAPHRPNSFSNISHCRSQVSMTNQYFENSPNQSAIRNFESLYNEQIFKNNDRRELYENPMSACSQNVRKNFLPRQNQRRGGHACGEGTASAGKGTHQHRSSFNELRGDARNNFSYEERDYQPPYNSFEDANFHQQIGMNDYVDGENKDRGTRGVKRKQNLRNEFDDSFRDTETEASGYNSYDSFESANFHQQNRMNGFVDGDTEDHGTGITQRTGVRQNLRNDFEASFRGGDTEATGIHSSRQFMSYGTESYPPEAKSNDVESCASHKKQRPNDNKHRRSSGVTRPGDSGVTRHRGSGVMRHSFLNNTKSFYQRRYGNKFNTMKSGFRPRRRGQS